MIVSNEVGDAVGFVNFSTLQYMSISGEMLGCIDEVYKSVFLGH